MVAHWVPTTPPEPPEPPALLAPPPPVIRLVVTPSVLQACASSSQYLQSILTEQLASRYRGGQTHLPSTQVPRFEQ